MASSIVLEKLLNKHLIFLSLANLVIMILIIIAGSKGMFCDTFKFCCSLFNFIII